MNNSRLNTIYFALFPLAFLADSFSYSKSAPIVILILVWSYYKLLIEDDSNTVIYLAICSRMICGFISVGSYITFMAGVFLTSVAPIAIVFTRRRLNGGRCCRERSDQLLWLSIYIVLISAMVWAGFDNWIHTFKSRVFPLVLFWMALYCGWDSINKKAFIQFARYLTISMLIIQFIPGYLEIKFDVLTNPIVFPTPVLDMAGQDLFRNMGVFWDSRILGIYCYTVLFVILRNFQDQKFSGTDWFDVFITSALLFTSLSRGSILVGGFIIAPSIISLLKNMKKTTIFMVGSGGVVITAIIIWYINFIDAGNLFELLSISNEQTGPLSQRQHFIEYAWQMFLHNPLGSGLGAVTSPLAGLSIASDEKVFSQASDAHWAIMLAEMGIFGTALFIISFLKSIRPRTLVEYAFVLGFFIQIVGTDVPDMSIFYFAFLLIWSFSRAKPGGAADVPAPERQPAIQRDL